MKEGIHSSRDAPVLLSLWTEHIPRTPRGSMALYNRQFVNPQRPRLETALLLASMLDISHPTQAALFPKLCQHNLLLVKYSQESDLPAREVPSDLVGQESQEESRMG